MADKELLTAAKHRKQIKKYGLEQGRYEVYAAVLRRVLEKACKASFPEALVQARSKSLSSFAEKAARKFDKYPDAVNQMTDLCGARVIVQTVEQVEAVKRFVRANFAIYEEDEKGMLLGEDRFGYRDMHFIIGLRADRNESLGITPREIDAIGTRKAELQVRTWLQHAWADTLHDRLYKNPLRLSSEIRRAGNLLAALMEEGDRNYNNMANDLDGMIANYTAYASRNEVLQEIEIQRLILANEQDPGNKPALALRLGRLLAACGDFKKVVEVLEPHAGAGGAIRCAVIEDLGYALCKVHRARPTSREYQRGCELLEEAVDLCCREDCSYVPHLRRRESLHARALSRLAWVLEAVGREKHPAREYYQKAHEHEPDNPYYLADMLGFEMYCTRDRSLSCAMRTTLKAAVQTCHAHAEAGIELPRAYFVAGRLCLLLGEAMEALGYYARGIYHCLAGTHCVPSDAMARETQWVERLHVGDPAPPAHRWVLDLLALAEPAGRTGGEPAAVPKVLILAGGAGSLGKKALAAIRPLIEEVLETFEGTVISGGTTVGVPGCAGEVARSLAARRAKQFTLIGYLPDMTPHDAPKDARYDRIIVCGESGFTPDQILQSWRDLFMEGIAPHEVVCVGFGGGPLAMVEYQVALALGGRVLVAHGSGGSADAAAGDVLWAGIGNLMPIPLDRATFRALIRDGSDGFDADKVEEMAEEFHSRYVAGSAGRLPANMRPWQQLDETYRKSNREQARYAVRILEACGFKTRPSSNPVVLTDFSDDEIERMAELEHGRWNVERLRDGWRPGKTRNDAAKIHNCILPWSQVQEEMKKYDRIAVRAFPEILARAELEVSRA